MPASIRPGIIAAANSVPTDSLRMSASRMRIRTATDSGQAMRSPAGERTAQQAATILDYYRATDAEFWKRKLAVADVAVPLKPDPKLTELEQALAAAETLAAEGIEVEIVFLDGVHVRSPSK